MDTSYDKTIFPVLQFTEIYTYCCLYLRAECRPQDQTETMPGYATSRQERPSAGCFYDDDDDDDDMMTMMRTMEQWSHFRG